MLIWAINSEKKFNIEILYMKTTMLCMAFISMIICHTKIYASASSSAAASAAAAVAAGKVAQEACGVAVKLKLQQSRMKDEHEKFAQEADAVASPLSLQRRLQNHEKQDEDEKIKDENPKDKRKIDPVKAHMFGLKTRYVSYVNQILLENPHFWDPNESETLEKGKKVVQFLKNIRSNAQGKKIAIRFKNFSGSKIFSTSVCVTDSSLILFTQAFIVVYSDFIDQLYTCVSSSMPSQYTEHHSRPLPGKFQFLANGQDLFKNQPKRTIQDLALAPNNTIYFGTMGGVGYTLKELIEIYETQTRSCSISEGVLEL